MKTKSTTQKGDFSKKELAANTVKTLSQKKDGDKNKKPNKTVADEENDVEVEYDWEKTDDDHDPDFEEFDIPKSLLKKPFTRKGKGDEDFYLDENFKNLDLFNDDAYVEDEDDDF